MNNRLACDYETVSYYGWLNHRSLACQGTLKSNYIRGQARWRSAFDAAGSFRTSTLNARSGIL